MSSADQPATELPSEQGLNGRDRFLRACRCQAVDRPPVWLMRQAGRALPEYRQLKERFSFLDLVRTPGLAAEVTLQPIKRFGFDAAILFSDILVVCEAMGQGYHFREGGGIQMDYRVASTSDIDKLQPEAVDERLQYASAALGLIKTALEGRTALIGFSGSPWTLANFMLEGGSSTNFTRARGLLEEDPRAYKLLMRKLRQAIIGYLRMQIKAGADALQIFDTLGGALGPDRFAAASGDWIAEIIAELDSPVPVIVFSKGVNDSWEVLQRTGAQVLGVDWTVDLAAVRSLLPANVAVQGNLDPALLLASPEETAAATRRLLESMGGCRGHICNLGHGVPPEARLDSIRALVTTVQQFSSAS